MERIVLDSPKHTRDEPVRCKLCHCQLATCIIKMVQIVVYGLTLLFYSGEVQQTVTYETFGYTYNNCFHFMTSLHDNAPE